jgi:hypothetical protein
MICSLNMLHVVCVNNITLSTSHCTLAATSEDAERCFDGHGERNLESEISRSIILWISLTN